MEKAVALHGECQKQRKPKKNGDKCPQNFDDNATADQADDVKPKGAQRDVEQGQAGGKGSARC